MGELKIREAKITDKDDLFILAKNLATSFTVQKYEFEDSLKNVIDDNSSIILCAEIDNKCVGYILAFYHYAFYANGKVGWIEELMVQENYRSMDIGKKLVQKVEDWGREKEVALVAMATRRAGGFYEKLGYEKSATYYKKTF